jgi:hypothetical protein
MPVSRYYSTAAVEMRLGTALANAGGGASIGDSVTITLSNAPGASGTFNLPTNVPFTLILDPDTSNEEVVEVTSITTINSTYVITRAVDSSNLSAHSVGAVVKHGVSARDYADSRTHEAATTGVHGLSAGVAIAPLASPTFTGTVTAPTVAVTTALNLTGNLSASGATITPTELSYLDTVSSNVQTQLDAKSPIASPTFTGTVTGPVINATTKFQVNGVDVTGLTAGWTSVTSPVLKATTTNPTLGTGSSATGKYIQIGKTVHFTFVFTFGSSGVNAGSGFYTVDLPVTAATSNHLFIGSFFDSSTGNYYRLLFLDPSSSSTGRGFYQDGGPVSQALGSSLPVTPAANDSIRISGTYEAA